MNLSIPSTLQLNLPAWAPAWIDDRPNGYGTDEAKMALALALAEKNVAEGTGGPFGAAVFEVASGQLVAIGVNRVVEGCASIAHAEIMALLLAQQAMRSHRINRDAAHVLATSAQPCAMCFGATIWAGIDELLIGARRSDVQSITGFDEGPLPAAWIRELHQRGIAVRRDILRRECCASLRKYVASGGVLY